MATLTCSATHAQAVLLGTASANSECAGVCPCVKHINTSSSLQNKHMKYHPVTSTEQGSVVKRICVTAELELVNHNRADSQNEY